MPPAAETHTAPAPDPIAAPRAIVEAYRDETAPKSLSPRAVFEHDEILRAYEQADYPAVESMAIVALAATADDQGAPAIWVLSIRAVANQGRLHEAGELCARALEGHPLVAELHCLHATLLAEAGWHADAAVAARRSIYLDRKLVMGHLLLGDAQTRTGDSAGARRSFENVIALLADADPDMPITAADGVLPARLRQIATLRLAEDSAVTRR